MLSVLDIFRIGIGPSSSHTVGPMRIAARFADSLGRASLLSDVRRIRVFLQGSLAFTGEGHATPSAVIFGLLGYSPETIDIEAARSDLQHVFDHKRLRLAGTTEIHFDPESDIVFDYESQPDLHPNCMIVEASGSDGEPLDTQTYYSTGGGFIATRMQLQSPAQDDLVKSSVDVEHPFTSAAQITEMCHANGLSISELVLVNEDAFRERERTCERLDHVIQAMMDSIDRGLETEGTLPGKLNVPRRAPALWNKLKAQSNSNEREQVFDWLNVYAMAVNEENASGGKVVTAPTNGAAGIIPAVIRHYCMDEQRGLELARQLLLTAGGIGLLYKQRASISGAEMGCQGEVGVACSMAAGGLAAVWGGTVDQVTSAAEIAMEHNLGLTCDPVGGLVQIPCIERNAIGAVKAVNAARLALHRCESPSVSLDQVIETMRQTGQDMSSKYKETSQGGLAVNVVEC